MRTALTEVQLLPLTLTMPTTALVVRRLCARPPPLLQNGQTCKQQICFLAFISRQPRKFLITTICFCLFVTEVLLRRLFGKGSNQESLANPLLCGPYFPKPVQANTTISFTSLPSDIAVNCCWTFGPSIPDKWLPEQTFPVQSGTTESNGSLHGVSN